MSVKVELGFTEEGQGAPFFTLDDPVLGVLDSPNVFLGGADVFVDVTEFLDSYSLNRGKSRELERYQAGQLSVSFNNATRAFDPTFEASPYFGQIVPKRAIRVSNNDKIQFQGVVEDWNVSYERGGNSLAVAQCFDSISFLAGRTFGEVTFEEESTKERINSVLDAIEWSDELRDLGDTVTNVSAGTAVADTNVLEYLQTIARGEPGDLFIDKTAKLKFVGRNEAFTSDGLTFADDGSGVGYKTIEAVFGSEELFNQVTVTSSAGTAIRSNSSSIGEYGERDLVRNTFLSTAEEVGELADFLVDRFELPEFRFQGITVDLRAQTEEVKNQILDLELGNIVEVKFTPNEIPPQIVRYGKIIGIQQQVTPSIQQVVLKLQTTDGALLVLDDQVFGRLDRGNELGW